MVVGLRHLANHLPLIKFKGVLKGVLVEHHKLTAGKLNHDHLRSQNVL